MRGPLAASRAHRPGELGLAMRTAGMGLERVECATATVGSADPLHSDKRRIAACWARDVGSAIVGVEADRVKRVVCHRVQPLVVYRRSLMRRSPARARPHAK